MSCVAKKKLLDRYFTALTNKDGKVRLVDLKNIFKDAGFMGSNIKVKSIFDKIDSIASNEIDFDEFYDILHKDIGLCNNIFEGNLVIKNFKSFQEQIEDIFNLVKSNDRGKVASYIPELKGVDPNNFSVSVCTVDGQTFSIGDTEEKFCIQSMCKPFLYSLALKEHGKDKVHKHVGREPSGVVFNHLSLNDNGLPHNPLINSGAIMVASLIKNKVSEADRYKHYTNFLSKLCGGEYIGFNNAIYASEKKTADRNFALSYFMREQGAFPKNVDILSALDFYFQACSVNVDTSIMSSMAATLANGGKCPLTGKRVLSHDQVTPCLSMMDSCGMYSYSGEWTFLVGVPAKSGVSGGIFIVVPNLMGICIWSPKLDKHGNSIRGVDFAKNLVKKFHFHRYNSVNDLLKRNNKRDDYNVFKLLNAAASDDIKTLIELTSHGVNLDSTDYDSRTALHLSCAEGSIHTFNYLINRVNEILPVDRWGNTPLDDAKNNNHTSLVDIYQTLLSNKKSSKLVIRKEEIKL